MSEVDTRPAATRGRSSHRGGRGGFGRGGTRGGSRKPVNGTTSEAAQLEESFEDQGEIGEMKKKYATELPLLKDMFPDWTDVDLVFALEEADGDVPATVDRITQGNVSQFSEVKSVKDRARSKVKEASISATASEKPALRGGRGRGGHESTRGPRGRGSDRGRVASRGGRGSHATVNGAPKDVTASITSPESTAWDDSSHVSTAEGGWDTATQDVEKDAGDSAWANVMTSDSTPATASEGAKSSLIPEGGAKKSWASMFAPKPAAPVSVKRAPAPQPPPAELVAMGEVPSEVPKEAELTQPPPVILETLTPSEPSPIEPPRSSDGSELIITPSKDPLTEENVEHLPDESQPPATLTTASTAGSNDPRNLTPVPNTQAPIARPPLGGYATSAQRATMAGRSASYQRRVQEQQEAVVMPGHNAVDRAAVQFGSMGLNGEPGPDVDEDREEPETRHAPQHSPPSQPKTALPPAPRQATMPQDPMMSEHAPTPKAAPGLPPASQHNQQQIQEAAMAPPLPETTSIGHNYGQYGRYAQPGMQQQDSGAPQHKPYDPSSHQTMPTPYDQYGTQTQQAPHQQQHSQSSFGGMSSAPSEYTSYYTADQRSAYNNYYGSNYGPQDARSHHLGQGQQDTGMGQQRSASGFGAVPNESAFASQVHQQVSIPTSLLELNAALENCNNEHERQYLLNEIQRVVSNAQMQPKPESMNPHGMPAYIREQPVMENNVKGDALFQGQASMSSNPLADVTNRKHYALSPSSADPRNIHSNPTPKQAQSRFGDVTGSGHNTPNPPVGAQQQSGMSAQQSQHSMHPQQSHQQQQTQQQQQQSAYAAAQAAGFPYGHQYYNSPYPQAYQNQFAYGGQPGGGYGGYPNPKQHAGMYGSSHGYGMAPQSSYEQHSASPANTGAFGQNQQAGMRSTSGMSSGLSGLDEYGRGSAQSHQQSSGFGGMNDPFGRSTSSFGTQGGYGQQSMAGQDDSLKPFSDAKGGSSPALGQPGVRPGSATNNTGASAQSGLPPPQSHQSAFGGGYPGFTGQNQYGLGGLGSQQQQQQHGQGAYGGYGGGGGFSQTYGSYGNRGGWGSQYGAH